MKPVALPPGVRIDTEASRLVQDVEGGGTATFEIVLACARAI